MIEKSLLQFKHISENAQVFWGPSPYILSREYEKFLSRRKLSAGGLWLSLAWKKLNLKHLRFYVVSWFGTVWNGTLFVF